MARLGRLWRFPGPVEGWGGREASRRKPGGLCGPSGASWRHCRRMPAGKSGDGLLASPVPEQSDRPAVAPAEDRRPASVRPPGAPLAPSCHWGRPERAGSLKRPSGALLASPWRPARILGVAAEVAKRRALAALQDAQRPQPSGEDASGAECGPIEGMASSASHPCRVSQTLNGLGHSCEVSVNR